MRNNWFIFVQETEKKNGEEKEENIWQGFARMVRMVTVMAMHVQLCTYLMFVNFGNPTTLFRPVKSTPKSSSNKIAKIGRKWPK